MISIRGWIDSGKRTYVIEDNGRGMSNATIHEILYKESTSIGIKNTIARIQMTYGDSYGVAINSLPGKGTMIVITLPLNT